MTTTDVLILNTAVADLRREDFIFVDELVGPGGLARFKTRYMPSYPQAQIRAWIEQGCATAGGPGNSAPLMARAGLNVAVGCNLGKGVYDGLDAPGRFFHDVMTANGVDMSATLIHPDLPTGTTFIRSAPGGDRGGLAYFSNANDDFVFELFKPAVKRLRPGIVYYMYSGLSERGDGNNGKDLAEFIGWCRNQGAITIVDSHTLTSRPRDLIEKGAAVKEYTLLAPLLPEVDLFFTSCDEAALIENTLKPGHRWNEFNEHENIARFLKFITESFLPKDRRTRMVGVTVRDGAYERHVFPDNNISPVTKIESGFQEGDPVDLVGAGDAFRAGLISYIARNLERFKDGTMVFKEAAQMGNLFASLYIKAPLKDRYSLIREYDTMLEYVRRGMGFKCPAEREKPSD